MNEIIRRQLTLFVGRQDAVFIEHIRQKFNPIQRELIDAHVTLCREHELENMAIITANLQKLDVSAIAVQFGQVIRFDDGKGVLIPSVGKNESFHTLRSQILQGISLPITTQPEPHITLMHPRNATCTDEIFEEIKQTILPTLLTFDTVSLIEQLNGGK
jgi:hypothetical protein